LLDPAVHRRPTSVRRSLTAALLGPEGVHEVDLELRYDSSSPYAVTATFHVDQRRVSWVFARDRLRVGVTEPTGAGDVHVRPHLDEGDRAAVLLELRSPQGIGLVLLPASEVLPFVASSNEAVEPGTESGHLDIDAALRAVLVGERYGGS
jgi:hypothetical protein